MRTIFLLAALCLLASVRLAGAQTVFINELHYDNAGTDSDEGVEIAGPAGTDLTAYDIVLYNGGDNKAYKTLGLSGTIPNEAAGFGGAWFYLAGIQNGAPDGIALYHRPTSTVVQFLSYEGVMTAADGVAAGRASVDIGVSETGTASNSPVGKSLQLRGTGTVYTDFVWNTATLQASRGLINPLQAFTGMAPRATIFVQPLQLAETGTATGTVFLMPPPAATTVVTLVNPDTTELTVPASVNVPVAGFATFSLAGVADGITDGGQVVTLGATAPGFAAASAPVLVTDVNFPPPPTRLDGPLRVMAWNVLFGVGTPGSADFNKVREVVARLDPDVIAFEEVDAANDFADLKSLVAQLGFQTTRQYFASVDDQFVADTYESGDFTNSTNQCVALASRFPITRTEQIGRGDTAVDGRLEMARYPLLVQVDVPGTTNDPTFVVVHYKASDTLADEFRRAVEGYRTARFLTTTLGLDGATSNIFIIGDFNEDLVQRQTASFPAGHDLSTVFTDPAFPGDASLVPASYKLGPPLAGANQRTLGVTLAYSAFPNSAFASLHASALDTRQADGTTRSYNASGNTRIDYIVVSDKVRANGPVRSEIYNSVIEAGYDGLPKDATLPAPALSREASDHFVVYGDFYLDPGATLTLAVSPADVVEGQTNVTATVSLPAPLAQPLAVSLGQWRPGGVSGTGTTVSIPAGQTQATARLDAPLIPGPQADRSITITAAATGYADGQASLRVRNRDASGLVLISQYTEPATNAGDKAVEILNNSGAPINFADTPLVVRRYTNGATTSTTEATVEAGTLPTGGVLVIGDAATRDYLLGAGLAVLPSGQTVATLAPGTLLLNIAGAAAFLWDSFTYNGDDALELVLAHTKSDVLGLIGQDPGTAWTGGGLSTADQNLLLRSTAGTGSTGWTNPSLRFQSFGIADSFFDLGNAPVLSDPYLDWAGESFLTGLKAAPSSDPDGDGLSNLLEFALAQTPTLASIPVEGLPFAAATGTTGPVLRRRAGNMGAVTFTLLRSPDLTNWSPVSPPFSTSPSGDGTETVIFSDTPLGAGETRRFYRFRVEKP